MFKKFYVFHICPINGINVKHTWKDLHFFIIIRRWFVVILFGSFVAIICIRIHSFFLLFIFSAEYFEIVTIFHILVDFFFGEIFAFHRLIVVYITFFVVIPKKIKQYFLGY